MSSNRITTAIWILLFASLFPFQHAHAYLDAGTGSYVIQILIGVVFGAGLVIKGFSQQISGFIRSLVNRGRTGNKKDE